MPRVIHFPQHSESAEPDLDLFRDGCLSIVEAAKFLGISRARIYEHVQAGDIPSVRDGRRRLVPLRGLVRFLATLAREE